MMELDELDRLAAAAFPGYVVRKDLANRFKGQYPVPTYVGEFLIGRYCATIDEAEIMEGLEIVERQMRNRTVRPGEQELFKSRAREQGTVKLIDLVTARLDARTDSYLATLPSLQITDVRIDAETVAENERLLTGGFYAEIQLEYDAIIAQEKKWTAVWRCRLATDPTVKAEYIGGIGQRPARFHRRTVEAVPAAQHRF
jgi:ATP-dependent Lon protease